MSKILFNGTDINEAVLPPYEVGLTHEISFQLSNDYDVMVEYMIESLNPEIKIIKFPKTLEGRKKDDLIVSFTPDKNLRESFISNIKVKEVFR
jgi:hypothetical protein